VAAVTAEHGGGVVLNGRAVTPRWEQPASKAGNARPASPRPTRRAVDHIPSQGSGVTLVRH
jgi:hypothetical protein